MIKGFNMGNEIQFKESKEDFESLFTSKRNYTFLVGAGISMDPPSNLTFFIWKE